MVRLARSPSIPETNLSIAALPCTNDGHHIHAKSGYPFHQAMAYVVTNMLTHLSAALLPVSQLLNNNTVARSLRPWDIATAYAMNTVGRTVALVTPQKCLDLRPCFNKPTAVADRLAIVAEVICSQRL